MESSSLFSVATLAMECILPFKFKLINTYSKKKTVNQ